MGRIGVDVINGSWLCRVCVDTRIWRLMCPAFGLDRGYKW